VFANASLKLARIPATRGGFAFYAADPLSFIHPPSRKASARQANPHKMIQGLILRLLVTIRGISVFVLIVVSAISCGFPMLAAIEEPVATERPSEELSPKARASEGSPSATAPAEEKPEVLYTSPSGMFRIERIGQAFSGGEGESTGDIWIVSAKDPTQRAKLPKQSSESPLDDEFRFSPNEKWIFATRYVGSGLRYGNVYHLANPLQIDMPTKGESFNDLAWENCVKLGALKDNYASEGVHATTFFVCWSLDSGRVLIELSGGEEKRSMRAGLLYFNTRARKFETTDYVRKLNKRKSGILACAEPVDPLPGEAELKRRLDALDEQLNKNYADVLASDRERVPLVREGQRKWIKQRDEGLKLYVSLFPPAERERRRLQFLGDVAAARIELPPGQWEL